MYEEDITLQRWARGWNGEVKGLLSCMKRTNKETDSQSDDKMTENID